MTIEIEIMSEPDPVRILKALLRAERLRGEVTQDVPAEES